MRTRPDAGRPGRDQRWHDAGLGRGPARGRQRHGLWRRAVVDGGPGADAGRDGQSAGQRPAASPGRRQAASGRHDLGRAGHPPVVQCRHRGERQDGRQWPLEHQGRHRSVGRQERPGARQRQPVPLRRPGPAHRRHGRHRRDGGHGRRHAARRGRPRHFRDGHGHGQLAGQSVGAAAHERGRHRHRAERRSDHASRRRPEGGRERAFAVLGQAGRQGRRRYRLGRHAGGRRRIVAGGHGRRAAGRHHCRVGHERPGHAARARRTQPRPCRPAATCPCRADAT